MNRSLSRILDATHDVHIPMPITETDTAEYRLKQKPILKNKLVHDCETLDPWFGVTYTVSAAVATNYDPDAQDPDKNLAKLSLSDEQAVFGSHSVRFDCPTNLPKLNEIAPGRIYAVPTALCRVDRENWEEYNRLSVYIYPHAPGLKTLTLRMQLYNDGAHKVPDIYDREGAHNITLKPDVWNYCVLEIPYLARDEVTGVGFEYDMVGHENDAADQVTFYLDKLEVQTVDCDVYEGWIPKNDRLCYAGSGYQPGSVKVAIGSGLKADTFRLVELATGRILLEKPIAHLQNPLGNFDLLDFSEVMEEGNYMLTAGDVYSRAFAIGNDCYERSVWHVLNFFLAERCGYDVYGKHRACHGDMLLIHDGKSIVANGGWHDAADVAQSLPNTTDGVIALSLLAQNLKDKGFDRLRERVIDEARWGLDYVLKMRFGDGYRGTYSSASIWTNGIIGDHDDITTDALDNSFDNLGAAYAEALSAQVLSDIDADLARYCIRIAEEDYAFGIKKWEIDDALPERPYRKGDQPFVNSDIIDVQICSAGACAAAKLYSLTGKEGYMEDAVRFAKRLISCQQQEFTDWDTPMTGFFYQDRERDLIWHHYHLAYSQFPETALRTLCETFPDAEEYIDWYTALTLSGAYYKKLHTFTAPYGMIPAGVYHEDEPLLGAAKLQNGEWEATEEYRISEYQKLVKAGTPIGGGYYVRAFPVWYSYRGNYNVLLSEAAAMNASATYRDDHALYQAVQDQYRFIVGQNPFGQSTMVGEGYDFVQHYAVQPGQSAGSLTVGMQSFEEKDAPYWPQVNTATYKEVWICSATKWIWGMADSLAPAKVCGCIKADKIQFTHPYGGVYTVEPHPLSGYYEITLPAGEYRMEANGRTRALTVVTGKTYPVSTMETLRVEHTAKDGMLTLTVIAPALSDVKLLVSGVDSIPQHLVIPPEGFITLRAKLLNDKLPYVGVAVFCGERYEFTDPRL